MTLGKSPYLSGIFPWSELKPRLRSSCGSKHGPQHAGERLNLNVPQPAQGCVKTCGPTSAKTPYLTVPCGEARGTTVAAAASGPAEHRGSRERGRKGRTAETLGNISEKRTTLETQADDAFSTKHAPPAPASVPRPGALLSLSVPADNKGRVIMFRIRLKHSRCLQATPPLGGSGPRGGVNWGQRGCGAEGGGTLMRELRVEEAIDCTDAADEAQNWPQSAGEKISTLSD